MIASLHRDSPVHVPFSKTETRSYQYLALGSKVKAPLAPRLSPHPKEKRILDHFLRPGLVRRDDHQVRFLFTFINKSPRSFQSVLTSSVDHRFIPSPPPRGTTYALNATFSAFWAFLCRAFSTDVTIVRMGAPYFCFKPLNILAVCSDCSSVLASCSYRFTLNVEY